MKTLNLTEGFNPYGATGSQLIAFDAFTFKGGEPHIRLISLWEHGEDINVSVRIDSFEDFGFLLAATYAIEEVGNYGNINLVIPYFPAARQDRAMVKGEPLTVKMYADIINGLGVYNLITIIDPHSDVAPALINNSEVVTNHKWVEEMFQQLTSEDSKFKGEPLVLVSPDAGANKKVKDLAKYLTEQGYEFEVVKCDKTRDVKTGAISGFEVYADDLKGKCCVIVDDICDGGGTFVGLADQLDAKGAESQILFVTHGIFSRGFKQLLGYFDKIYTTNSVDTFRYAEWIDEGRIHVLKIER